MARPPNRAHLIYGPNGAKGNRFDAFLPVSGARWIRTSWHALFADCPACGAVVGRPCTNDAQDCPEIHYARRAPAIVAVAGMPMVKVQNAEPSAALLLQSLRDAVKGKAAR